MSAPGARDPDSPDAPSAEPARARKPPASEPPAPEPRAPPAPAREPIARRRGPRLAANLAGGLAYAGGPLTGAIFLLDRRPFVRFHALQSLGFVAGVAVAGLALGVLRDLLVSLIPPFGTLAGLALGVGFGLVVALSWLRLMHRAFGGGAWPLPGLGAVLARALEARSG